MATLDLYSLITIYYYKAMSTTVPPYLVAGLFIDVLSNYTSISECKAKTHEVRGSKSIMYESTLLTCNIYTILFVHLFYEPTDWCYSTN